MSKSELLACEVDKIEVYELQDRINKNSKLINDLTNKLVASYCKQLDEYIRFIEGVLRDDKHPPTELELDDMVMNLPVLLYFCGEAQENLGIKTDVAKAVKQEKYNEIYNEVSGTIADKTARSELASQTEAITHIIYDRAYKIVKNKMEAAFELLQSIKKVISRRTAELELGKVDSARFR